MRSFLFILAAVVPISLFSQEKTASVKALIDLSEKLFDEKKYDSAHHYSQVAYDQATQKTNDSLRVITLLQRVITSSEIDMGVSDSLYTITEDLAKSSKNRELLARTYFIKGRILYRAKEHGLAQPYLLKVDSLASRYGFLSATVIRAILARSEISRTTFTYEGVEKASDLQEQALVLAKCY